MAGYTKEDLAMVLRPMAEDAHEPTFSMGDDSPLPSLASRTRPIAHFLRQRFAQVTNPPIDPVRERRVMSLRTLLGPRAPLLLDTAEAARLLVLRSFFLFPDGVDTLYDEERCPFATIPLDATFPVAEGPDGLRAAVERICDEAEAAVAGGAGIVVVEDCDISAERAAVPSLLACGAVHHRLVSRGLRSQCGVVVVSDTARDTHEVAALLGYGADADENGDATGPEAQDRLQAAMEEGVLKILSKMGISTVDSYRGAQIFEVIGLAPEVVDVCFAGTATVVGGIGWTELGKDVLARHDADAIAKPGYYR